MGCEMKRVLCLTLAAVFTVVPQVLATLEEGSMLPEITVTSSFPSTVQRGAKVTGAITIEIPKGWHIYAPGDHKYKKLTVSQGKGWVTNVKFTYPPGVTQDVAGERVPLYEGRVEVKFEGEVSKKAATGHATWKPEITWQSCSDTICLAPETGALAIEFEIKGNK
jgi:DsbC/DsbD-like thiol-disulfide interchange protein